MPTGELYLTWNFFLTLILVPGVGWWITNGIKKRDTLQTDNLKLMQDKQDQELHLWQKGAMERNQVIVDKLDRLDKTICSLKSDMKGKVDHDYCKEKHGHVDNELGRLRNNGK